MASDFSKWTGGKGRGGATEIHTQSRHAVVEDAGDVAGVLVTQTVDAKNPDLMGSRRSGAKILFYLAFCCNLAGCGRSIC